MSNIFLNVVEHASMCVYMGRYVCVGSFLSYEHTYIHALMLFYSITYIHKHIPMRVLMLFILYTHTHTHRQRVHGSVRGS
jgi:hypothetical protein